MQKNKFKLDTFVAVILKKDNKILLTKRKKNGWGNSEYALPGGSVDGNETLRVAASREMNEELDIIVNPDNLEILHISHRKLSNGIGEILGIFLQAEKWDGEVKNMELDKCYEIGWFDIDNLPENTVKELNIVMQKINKKEIYSEIGW